MQNSDNKIFMAAKYLQSKVTSEQPGSRMDLVPFPGITLPLNKNDFSLFQVQNQMGTDSIKIILKLLLTFFHKSRNIKYTHLEGHKNHSSNASLLHALIVSLWHTGENIQFC